MLYQLLESATAPTAGPAVDFQRAKGPTAVFQVQCDAPEFEVVLEGRVVTEAPWALVVKLKKRDLEQNNSAGRFVSAFPQMRARVVSITGGTLHAWASD